MFSNFYHITLVLCMHNIKKYIYKKKKKVKRIKKLSKLKTQKDSLDKN